MGKSIFFVLLVLISVAGCSDPALYETPLQNGYIHKSNGGEFGVVIKPKKKNGGPIEPLAMQRNGKEYWCNKYGLVKEYIICEVIEYGEKTFVDPPKSIHYLVFNTKSENYSTYKTLNELKEYWSKLTTSPLPELKKDHG